MKNDVNICMWHNRRTYHLLIGILECLNLADFSLKFYCNSFNTEELGQPIHYILRNFVWKMGYSFDELEIQRSLKLKVDYS